MGLAQAQERDVSPYVLAGPESTLLLVPGILSTDGTGGFGEFLPLGERIAIFRTDGNATDFKKVGELTFPASAKELGKRLGDAYLTEVLNQLGVRDIDAAYETLTRSTPDTLGLTLLSPELLEVFGLAFSDRSRSPEIPSVYRLDHLDGQSKVIRTAVAGVSGQLPTYAHHFHLRDYQVTDSLVTAVWSTGDALPDAFPVQANVFRREGPLGAFQQVGRRLVASEETSDSSRIYFNERVNPGSTYAYYVQVEDVVGNLGVASDTLYALTVDPSKIARISNLNVTDTLGGLLLKWDALPRQAVYGGVQILKSRQVGSDYVELDTIPATEVSYLDTRVIGATSYYYKVRPLILNLPNGAPLSFAETSGYKKGVDSLPPAAPRAVRATVTDRGVQISWQPGDELDLFGYYVLRGTSAANMEVISAPVQDTLFVDTTFFAQRAGQLHYALQAINLHQSVSDTSEVASVVLRQPVVLMAPGGIQVRRTVDGALLQWDNPMQRDDQVVGFVLYRRQSGEKEYRVISSDLLTLPFFTDSTALGTVDYEYAVASVDAWGNLSILSANAVLKADVGGRSVLPMQLYLRNLTSGIEIGWPILVEATGQHYILYRKQAGQSEFSKIGTVDAAGVFLDKEVKPDILYEYVVGIESAAGEVNRGLPQSIRRQ